MTNHELLRNAIWVCQQIHRFHETSYNMGVISHVADAESMPAQVKHTQLVMEAADKIIAEHKRRTGKPRKFAAVAQ